ncbi:MAG: ATP-grasp domain-containing protein [Sedimentisphaerales bacterium]|nr:ATP-grasp domain-containing protein [Sedimentisphaerales bacterium]
MSKKTGLFSLLIPDGETWETVKVLRCLSQAPGIRASVLSRSRIALSRFSRHCARLHLYDGKTDKQWLDAVGSVIKKEKIDVVLPVIKRGVEFVVRNRDEIEGMTAVVALPNAETLELLLDKWSSNDFAQRLGLPVAASIYLGRWARQAVAPDEADEFIYPAVLKPTSLSGGSGIIKLNSSSDFHRVWRSGNGLAVGERYILQSFINGEDCCLGVFCRRGKILAYTIQRSAMSSEAYFGPQRVMQFVEDRQLLGLGEKLLSALNYEGIAFVDFRIDGTDRSCKFIEVNPRFGQAILGSLAAGVNFPLLWCLDAIGKPLPKVTYRPTSYAHPAAFVKMKLQRLLGRQSPVALGWRQSGLRFTFNDPLPEVIDVLKRVLRLPKPTY